MGLCQAGLSAPNHAVVAFAWRSAGESCLLWRKRGVIQTQCDWTGSNWLIYNYHFLFLWLAKLVARVSKEANHCGTPAQGVATKIERLEESGIIA